MTTTTTVIPAPSIIVDTREQRPYFFENSTSTKLDTGDYSIEGYTDQICVERKSVDDYVQTLIKGRERFSRELTRMKTFKHACIIVECSLKDIEQGNYTSRAYPASILGMTMSIIVKHKIPVYFCGDRALSKVFTYKFLMRALKELTVNDISKK